ncbi:hypothetical protein RYX36_005373 [Vicia faba]
MSPLQSLLLFLSIILLFSLAVSEQNGDFQTLNTKFNPKIPLPPLRTLSSLKRFEGSSDLVKLKYHMGPVFSSPINIYLIWYGNWARPHKQLIKDFLLSISDTTAPHPSVSDWWRTVSLYTDQTGANISLSISRNSLLLPNTTSSCSLYLIQTPQNHPLATNKYLQNLIQY